MAVEEELEKLNINYDMVEHEAICTIKEAKEKVKNIDGYGCKCLFLKNKKNAYFLYTVLEDKRVDLKNLANKLETSRLQFASLEDLESLLGLEQGAVTPLGIINDNSNRVKLVFDTNLRHRKILVHPNRNTATLAIEYEDLLKYLKNLNHQVIEIESDI